MLTHNHWFNQALHAFTYDPREYQSTSYQQHLIILQAAEKSPGLVAMLSQAQEARGRSAERELKAMEAAALGPTSRSPKAEKRTSPMRKIQATRTSPLRKICEAQETPKSSRGDARSSPRSARGVHSEPRSPPVEVHKPSKPSKPSVAAAATHVPRLTKLLATPPKEPRKDLPRRAASQDRGEETAGESVKDEENLFDDTELRLYRQRQQMERHAQSAWEDAQRLAEHSARVEEAKKLQVVKERKGHSCQPATAEARGPGPTRGDRMREEKTEAAQKQRHEVEAALQRLRQAVVEVEERAAERTAKLRKQQEVAEEKAREQDALCEKDRGRLESLEEEAAERLKSVEATWAAKLKAQEKPLSCAEEALMQYINKSKSKMESKVKRLEEKATAEQKAVEEEASAQRVVAPQLAALKSEVLATERGAHAADEAGGRAEERACAEEARLGAFLKRLPQLEAFELLETFSRAAWSCGVEERGELILVGDSNDVSRVIGEIPVRLAAMQSMLKWLFSCADVRPGKDAWGDVFETQLDMEEAEYQAMAGRRQGPPDPSTVVFLDVDGVLHAKGDELDHFRASNMRALRRIVLTSNATVVLSSSWRRRPPLLQRADAVLQNWGLAGVADQTPDLKAQGLKREERRCFASPSAARGVLGRRQGAEPDEILIWLRRHPEVRHWLALDDMELTSSASSLVNALMAQHVIQTDPEIGLREMSQVSRALRVLQKSRGFVEAKQKGEQMAAEAEEKASLDVATAREDARLCREIAGRTVAASRQLVERTRSNGQDRLDRCTLEVTEAEKAALEALEEEKEASARLSARVAAEQRCCAAARKQRQMETKISADLSDLRESNAQKVLAAARVSEAAQLKSTKALRVAERDLETQKEELARKRDQASEISQQIGEPMPEPMPESMKVKQHAVLSRGPKLWCQQFDALFRKRALSIRRDRRAWASQLLLPAIFD
eukprot:g30298.t1